MGLFDENIAPEILAEFIDESLDGLESTVDLFVKLEKNPSDNAIIQSIFRIVHSIKGNAAFFGMMHTKDLAHALENVMDLLRNGALVPSTHIVNILLQGTDGLRSIFESVRAGTSEISDEVSFKGLVERIKQITSEEKSDEKVLWDRLLELVNAKGDTEIITLVNKLASCSVAAVDIAEHDDGQYRDESFLAVREMLGPKQEHVEPEELKTKLKHLRSVFESPQVDELINVLFNDIVMFENTIGLDDTVAREAMIMRLSELNKITAQMQTEDHGPESAQHKTPNKEPAEKDSEKAAARRTADSSSKTMRVPEESVDRFLNYIGELVTVCEMYTHLHARLSEKSQFAKEVAELRRVNETFYILSSSLQKSLLDIRMLPINVILQKIPRMVRDIATAQGKDIDVVITGADVRIDKSIIDALDAPLTHMVRNAADHGVESVEKRAACGKPAKGTVNVDVEIDSEYVLLMIKDDGNGLNLEVLAQKALEAGLVRSIDGLKEEQIAQFIFEPGISSAKEVTDISGRGVGMDVVRTSVEKKGGTVAVSSIKGVGTTFTIKMPKSVSTVIIQGFIVRNDKGYYVFPIETVVTAFEVNKMDLVTVVGKGQCIRRGDELYPAYTLSECLGEGVYQINDKHVMLLIELNNKTIAVAVEEIVGIRKCVLKAIDGLNVANMSILGAAVMGDSSVAMVVDVETILEESGKLSSSMN